MYYVIFRGTTAICPKNCVYCPVPWQKKLGKAINSPVNAMTMSDAERFILLNQEEDILISFNPCGEFLIIKEAFDIIELFKNHYTMNALSTSLALPFALTDEQIVLLLTSFRSLLIDLTYYHQPENLTRRAAQNVERLIQIHKEIKSTCELNITMVYHPLCKAPDHPAFARIRHRILVKPLYIYNRRFAYLFRGAGNVYDDWFDNIGVPIEQIVGDPMVNYFTDDEAEAMAAEPAKPCYPAGLQVSSRGTVSYCVISDDSNTLFQTRAGFGNVYQTPIRDLVNTPVAKKLLKAQETGTLFTKRICNVCPWKVGNCSIEGPMPRSPYVSSDPGVQILGTIPE